MPVRMMPVPEVDGSRMAKLTHRIAMLDWWRGRRRRRERTLKPAARRRKYLLETGRLEQLNAEFGNTRRAVEARMGDEKCAGV